MGSGGWGVASCVMRTDRQTHTHDEANRRLSQFCEMCLRITTKTAAQVQTLVPAGNKQKFPLTPKLHRGRRLVLFGTFDILQWT